MKRFILLLCLIILCTSILKLYATDKKDVPMSNLERDVIVGPNAISIPTGRILLVHKDSDYCAIKFVEVWIGGKKKGGYARYESYYQGDKMGYLSKKNVKYFQGKVHSPKSIWIGGGHYFDLGGKVEIFCGPIKLLWWYRTWVCFFHGNQKQGDYGVELAPTKWTNISEVNFLDPRLKWYRYDEERKDIYIPIDDLWEEKEEKK